MRSYLRSVLAVWPDAWTSMRGWWERRQPKPDVLTDPHVHIHFRPRQTRVERLKQIRRMQRRAALLALGLLVLLCVIGNVLFAAM